MDDAPLVVTLALAEADQERFDALRRAHFPPERLVVGAHVTLFHALPGAAEPLVTDALAAAADRPGFAVRVTDVRLLGRGVAYWLASGELAAVHADLLATFAAAFGEALTPQDRQRLAPHLTVQNKVTPERARATCDALAATFAPHEVTATGLALWRYRAGPWEHRRTLPFARPGPDGGSGAGSPP